MQISIDVISGQLSTGFSSRVAYDLTGTTGNDTMVTGNLADTLTGGDGADTLTGGGANDIFRYLTTSNFGDNIRDFVSNVDKLSFLGAVFNGDNGTSLATGALTNVSDGTHDGANENNYWIFDTVSHDLYYDLDAGGLNGSGQFVASFASNVTVLSNNDINFF